MLSFYFNCLFTLFLLPPRDKYFPGFIRQLIINIKSKARNMALVTSSGEQNYLDQCNLTPEEKEGFYKDEKVPESLIERITQQRIKTGLSARALAEQNRSETEISYENIDRTLKTGRYLLCELYPSQFSESTNFLKDKIEQLPQETITELCELLLPMFKRTQFLNEARLDLINILLKYNNDERKEIMQMVAFVIPPGVNGELILRTTELIVTSGSLKAERLIDTSAQFFHYKMLPYQRFAILSAIFQLSPHMFRVLANASQSEKDAFKQKVLTLPPEQDLFEEIHEIFLRKTAIPR
jgi:hypothetical protein